MRDETYDIPAYKFVLVAPTEWISTSWVTKQSYSEYQIVMSNQVSSGNFFTVPFEDVDGLKVSDALKLTDPDGYKDSLGIYFLGFAEAIKRSPYTLKPIKKSNQIIVLKNIFEPELVSNAAEERIDKFIENSLISDYPIVDEEAQAAIKCFLERYQYRTKEEVNNRILK